MTSPSVRMRRTIRKRARFLRPFVDELENTAAVLLLWRWRRRRRDLDEAIDFVEQFRVHRLSLAPLIQIRAEIVQFLRLLSDDPPGAVLEVGAAGGGTAFLFARVARRDAFVVSVDLPAGPFGGVLPRRGRQRVWRSFAGPGQRVELIEGDSHSSETLKSVRAVLGGRRLDLLFIDGDHSYEGVGKDFEMYAPLVRPGGLIALHDIVPGEEEAVGGVPRFWQETKDERSLEIVADWRQGGYGIGVIRTAPAGKGPRHARLHDSVDLQRSHRPDVTPNRAASARTPRKP